MEYPIPISTLLTVTPMSGGKETDYVCTVMGYGRYGIQLSMPQLLDQVYSVPAATVIRCSFISAKTNQFLSFKSYVMGYERTVPPCMVIALPTMVENATRRSSLRLPARVPVAYVAEGDASVYGEETETADLSLGGLKMTTSRVLPKGAIVSLTLELPDQTISVTGSVSWSSFKGRRAATGVRFTHLNSKALTALARYINDLERQVRPILSER